MRVKIYVNFENLASEQIYALFIYAFLSIEIKQHLLLLTDYHIVALRNTCDIAVTCNF